LCISLYKDLRNVDTCPTYSMWNTIIQASVLPATSPLPQEVVKRKWRVWSSSRITEFCKESKEEEK